MSVYLLQYTEEVTLGRCEKIVGIFGDEPAARNRIKDICATPESRRTFHLAFTGALLPRNISPKNFMVSVYELESSRQMNSPLNIVNEHGYIISFSSTPPLPDLLPLGTIVRHHGNLIRSGMIVAYNGYYNAEIYRTYQMAVRPYVVMWEDGYFDVYGSNSLQVST